jgi:hypothetical protein
VAVKVLVFDVGETLVDETEYYRIGLAANRPAWAEAALDEVRREPVEVAQRV